MRLANCVKRVRGANGLSGGTRQHGLLPVSTCQTSLHPRPYQYENIDRWTIALCPVELLQCVPNFWQGQLRTNHLASDHSSRFHCERVCVTTHTDVPNYRQARWTSGWTTVMPFRSRSVGRDAPSPGANTLCYHLGSTGHTRSCCKDSNQSEVVRAAPIGCVASPQPVVRSSRPCQP